MTHEQQRVHIQEEVNVFFGKAISIDPRAMAALQGDGSEDWDGTLTTTAYSIFHGLLRSSPLCLSLLLSSRLAVEQLLIEPKLQWTKTPSFLGNNTLQYIFCGIQHFGESAEYCNAAEEVFSKAHLTEVDLFRSFFETAYSGEESFSEKFDEVKFWDSLTDVGSLLIKSGFADPSEIIEVWNGEPGTYKAISKAARKFKGLADKIRSISTMDPNHSHFQYAVSLDHRDRVRLQPIGCGLIANLKDTEPCITPPLFRELIAQPVDSLGITLVDADLKLFEDMINSPKVKEWEFQKFFEKHPEFLAGINYGSIHPQLILSDSSGPELKPDFMLEPISQGFCDVLEIKLPHHKIVRRSSKDRPRFSQAVSQAISQLHDYSRFFGEPFPALVPRLLLHRWDKWPVTRQNC